MTAAEVSPFVAVHTAIPSEHLSSIKGPAATVAAAPIKNLPSVLMSAVAEGSKNTRRKGSKIAKDMQILHNTYTPIPLSLSS